MKDRRGFTLLEIVIVIAIIAIVAIIASTNLQLWQNHSSVVGFQREFLLQFNQARTRSMASSFQHRLLIDMNANAESVTLQRGNLGTASSTWATVGQRVVGSNGAGITRIDNCAPAVSGPVFALIFNPDGQLLVQDITAGTAASPLTEADIRISATSAADQATLHVFGWTSKARLLNGWP